MPRNISLREDANRVYPGYGLPLLGDPIVSERAPATLKDVRRQTTVQDLLTQGDGGVAAGEHSATDDSDLLNIADGELNIRRAKTLHEEIVFIGRSLRRSLTKPSTPLHILLLTDRLSIAEIAGRMRSDPEDVELHMTDLVTAGIVGVDSTGAVPRYSIIGLSGE